MVTFNSHLSGFLAAFEETIRSCAKAAGIDARAPSGQQAALRHLLARIIDVPDAGVNKFGVQSVMQ